MAVEGSPGAQGLAAAGPGAGGPGTLRAVQVVLRVLALLVFAQPVFAGASVPWVHVPLGVGILGGVGTLMARVRTLPHSPTGARR